jgi:hypothetical protein
MSTQSGPANAADWERIATSFQTFEKDIHRLSHEADLIYRHFVLPGWGGPDHGMVSTLYGYMMSAFSQIDLLSALWQGSERSQGQSQRMIAFMTKYMIPTYEINSLAVQIWRHKLMHTGSPRQLVDSKTGRTFRWLLHWGDEHLPRDQHFKLQSAEPILNISLFGLLENLEHAVTKFFDELSHDSTLRDNFLAVEKAISSYSYREIDPL